MIVGISRKPLDAYASFGCRDEFLPPPGLDCDYGVMGDHFVDAGQRRDNASEQHRPDHEAENFAALDYADDQQRKDHEVDPLNHLLYIFSITMEIVDGQKGDEEKNHKQYMYTYDSINQIRVSY